MSAATDKLKRIKQKSRRKEPKSKTKELRSVEVSATLAPQVRQVCELGYLTGEIKGPLDNQLKAVKVEFFNMWTQEMWDSKKKPDNFCVVLPKLDDKGKPIPGLSDTRCAFQIKFRADGIKSKTPKEEDLPDEFETVEEAIIGALQSVVGLSEPNAKKFVDAEVEVRDEVTLAMPLDKMLEADPETTDGAIYSSIGNKLVDYMQARTRAQSGKVKLPVFTEAEEASALVTVQVTYLKEGLFERVFTYCENIEQLRKLLTYCSVTLQVADFDFGMSDEPAVKAQRLQTVVGTYLLPATDEDE